ncbi:hypothetical protein [Streptomyces sp. HC307]|uniref:hypothetical protein n=1 Tax=Streptomyces flavusporus TaxID=3385496 RepID=UPI003916F0BE
MNRSRPRSSPSSSPPRRSTATATAPGLAAQLSVQYGGPQRSWEYVVRNALQHRAAPLGSQLAASPAREPGGSPDVWSRAVNAARRFTDPAT